MRSDAAAMRKSDEPDGGPEVVCDRLIIGFDRAWRTLFAPPRSRRAMPGVDQPEAALNESERRHVAALMRVNHSGEICAQALYQGQALASRNPVLRSVLQRAAQEEEEHLAWTERRLNELGGRKSLLTPFWYAGAFALGVLAGRLGDAWNLGFLAETERQVEAHLESHLRRLPAADRRSWAVLERMKADEIGHGQTAQRLGARPLPSGVRLAMSLAAGVMTRTAYWI